MLTATKLLQVCCLSVAGYKRIHVAGNKQHVAGQHHACCRQHVASLRNMLPWRKRGFTCSITSLVQLPALADNFRFRILSNALVLRN